MHILAGVRSCLLKLSDAQRDLSGQRGADRRPATDRELSVPRSLVWRAAGDVRQRPWHRDADRYPYLCDAVAAWLNAPTGLAHRHGRILRLAARRELSSGVLGGYELTASAFLRLLL
ncbi:hypothetical protein, partial [Streptomyces sp. NPDC005507]|uniref:hypothetical protein n=1 Tax=Streptomyces sp. NPDC005507 TaxID=3154885 RepID=UPI0033B6428F